MQENEKANQSHIKAIRKAQLYIQKNLDEELTLEKISRVACISCFHFHRIFRAFTGESLNHYIRRLRMEKAAGRLKYSEDLITEVALDSGYQTPASFTRAFQQTMGTTPTTYRSTKTKNVNRNQTTGEMKMIAPEVIEMPDLQVLFVRREGSYQNSPKEAWTALLQFASDHHLDLSKQRRFSIALDDPNITGEDHLRFDACITAPKEILGQGEVCLQTLHGGKYAVFVHKGPYEDLESTFDTIFREWYPKNKERVADQSCICEYINMEKMKTSPEELLTKIYLPLI